MDGIVEELRLLRQVVAWQNENAVRAQLLIARITVQSQRVNRASEELRWREGELRMLDSSETHTKVMAEKFARDLEEVEGEDERRRLESELEKHEMRLKELQAKRAGTEERLSRAQQLLDTEADRFEQLDRWLTDIDRRLMEGG